MGEESRILEAKNNKNHENLHISLINGLISIQATEATLQEVFKEIARIANIQIHGAINSKNTITISIDHLTVEEAIRGLTKNTVIIYKEKPSHSVPEIREIIVLSDNININPFPSEMDLMNRAIDTMTDSDQQLIDVPEPPPLPPPPPVDISE